LQAVLSSGLVLVSAPAGFGKTTLLAEWTRQKETTIPTAWISLDEGDNDPVRFWDYFIAALRTLRPAIGETASTLLHSPQPYPTELVLTALINDLADSPTDFALVLDDYHLIKTGAIHGGITFLLDHLPPKMHLIIATRSDPQLRLAHLRGRGAMLEVGADDLRFTFEEAADLLREVRGPDLSSEDISAVNARSEGWAVGLKMAGLSMRGQKDARKFLATFAGSQRYVMDYLVEEVLRQQPQEVQDFLLKTSVLERLTASLCDSITGQRRGQEMLVRLESAFGGFLVSLDESRKWYRYHHLFADLLRHQLGAISGAAQTATLHQRASEWYEGHDFPDDAVHHALASGDWERATRLIYAQSGARIKRGETVTLLNWLKAVPEESLRAHHQLYTQFAQLLTSAGEFEAAEARLGHLEEAGQDDTNLQGEIAVLRAGIAQNRGDYQRAIELSTRALSLLRPESIDARARASMVSGSAHFETGLFEDAWSLMTDACALGRRAADSWIVAGALAYLGIMLWQRGSLHQASGRYQEAIGLAGQSPASINPRLTLAYTIYYEWNDLEAAARQQELAIELSRLSGSTAGTTTFMDGRAVGHYLLAHVRRAQGDIAGAKTAAEKSDELAQNPGVARSVRARHAALRALLAVWQDDQAAIEYWNTQVSEFADALPFWLAHVPYRIMIARGEKEAAAGPLQALHDKAAQAELKTIVIRTLICQALAAATPAEALTFLTEALTLGQPEGFIRTFVDEGRMLAPLLRKALAQGITPEYTARLLSIIGVEAGQRRVGKGDRAGGSQSSGLVSERELEVLRLVAEGLSNRQIADRLTVSLGTAKTHVHRIFEKLNATDRLQAVVRARELNLI
jgi:LuxR family maltose regulon positive regulatory protein